VQNVAITIVFKLENGGEFEGIFLLRGKRIGFKGPLGSAFNVM
jgi:hypothetical protein